MKTNQIAETNLNRIDQGRLGASHLPHVTRRWVRKATRHLCLLWEGFGKDLKDKRKTKLGFAKKEERDATAMKTLAENEELYDEAAN